MRAVAICNNDMVYLHWHVADKIPNCLGFNVVRHDENGNAESLPAMVGFSSDTGAARRFKTTEDWPVQKFAWKDLFAKRGGTYWYDIVPMIGTPGALHADFKNALRTNTVVLESGQGTCSIYFNRGIISTQAIARALPKGKTGAPSTGALKKAIEDPTNKIRARLEGDLNHGVLSLLERAKQQGGECYCALYELSDKELLSHLLTLGQRVHIVLSNAGADTDKEYAGVKKGAGKGDGTNKSARRQLHRRHIDVADRMLKKGHIGHNKFVVYVNDQGSAEAVLSGSTNWTPNGLCAQSNNAIVIESPDLAEEYLAYWHRLKQDTQKAHGNQSKLQDKPFRTSNITRGGDHELQDRCNEPSGNVHTWFSPNTLRKSVNKKVTPPDLSEVFKLIHNAKQGILFLAFIPGAPSVVTEMQKTYHERRRKGELFYLRGAATSPDPASLFRVDLYHRSATSDATIRGVPNPSKKASARVASVAGIFQTFANWEMEIYKIGHAVIHDKILVIDPFTDDSVVITGSHNLGYRASYCNDENLLVIRGDRAVAAAYAAHVLDVYDHYRWRWQIQQPLRDEFEKAKKQRPKGKHPGLWKQIVAKYGPTVVQKVWQSLTPDDSWQDWYQKHKDFLAAEDNFWSPFSGVGKAP